MQRIYNGSCACTSLQLALGCLASAAPCHGRALAGLDVDGERGRVHKLPAARGAVDGRARLAGRALLGDVRPDRGGRCRGVIIQWRSVGWGTPSMIWRPEQGWDDGVCGAPGAVAGD